jgi:hypothetical protein
MSVNSVDMAVNRLGSFVSAQVSFVWSTKDVAAEYEEILDDCGEDTNFSLEDFLEYIRDNAAEAIRNGHLVIDVLDSSGRMVVI